MKAAKSAARRRRTATDVEDKETSRRDGEGVALRPPRPSAAGTIPLYARK
jgi:hypothetical protein